MEMTSFGEYLKSERELREISLREISDETKVSYRYLEAIEEDNESRLPAEVFTKGFIRSYANYIGLDADEAILRYQEYRKAKDSSGNSQAAGMDLPGTGAVSKNKKRSMILWILTALLAAAVVMASGYGLWRWREASSQHPSLQQGGIEKSVSSPESKVNKETKEVPIPGKEEAPPVPQNRAEGPQTEPAAPSPAPIEMILSARAQTWVSCDLDGKEHHDLIIRPGQEVRLKMVESIRLNIGNAGGLVLRANGKTLGPFGSSGQVIKNYVLTRKDLEGSP
ncbi:MAG: hypothetical protein COZ32_01720 [Nitrospirae bacterium CG_4_10_14_3_um_filter_53_41]|nr:MAG: hypothetical protein AUK29_08815 [Nitrospirae bacterium CG2_30_53_67]PIW85149.1 MAG: hypothetical protein COZ95_06085 [Nitrospirae bacterium CG_4_8_14_3_um_filter_50_41]PIX86757.1 MAG: hypothetical protein COZ32_01720 [Nitrospirae bacterium CG_4_10_14_3_um_filter_53_41]